MPQRLTRVFLTLVSLLLFVTCCSLPKEEYSLSEFYFKLAKECGIYEEKDPNELLESLKAWGMAEEIDVLDLNEKATFDQVLNDLNALNEALTEDYFKTRGIIKEEFISEEVALKMIDITIQKINHQSFENQSNLADYTKVLEAELKEDLLYTDLTLPKEGIILFENHYYRIIEVLDDAYKVEEVKIEALLEDLDLSFSSDLKIDEPIQQNEGPYKLLSYEDSLSDVLYQDGYRISYALSDNYARIYLSKEMENGLNFFSELILSNFQFDLNWKLKEEDYVYFKTSFISNERIGVSDGKYLRRYLDLKNLKDLDFKKGLSGLVSQDEVEAILPICSIQIPIPNLPAVQIEFEVVCKLYVSGRIELSLSQSNELGFEYKEGALRTIFNSDHKVEGILKANGKSAFNVGFAALAMDYRLADVGMDAGIQAKAQTTLHILNEDEIESSKVDTSYALLDYLVEDHPDFKACADLSLNWLFDLKLNSYRSLLGSLGIGRTWSILNEDHQIFGNLTHIENGQFVDHCTINERQFEIIDQNYNIDKILLERYNLVVLKDESFKVPILKLPENYSEEDLVIQSEDLEVVEVSNLICKAKKAGSTQLKIATKDGLYEAYMHILVSDG